jgi:hypothetical protein
MWQLAAMLRGDAGSECGYLRSLMVVWVGIAGQAPRCGDDRPLWVRTIVDVLGPSAACEFQLL